MLAEYHKNNILFCIHRQLRPPTHDNEDYTEKINMNKGLEEEWETDR